ncbi:metal-dependent hydrolase [Listeria monocytogenes]|nr:metal-dependent hydrolase [Listeria monocytogenes]EAC3953013.1 metal-dependent hydrolase [Listeria monocytogenes]EAC9555222.1 metal-dependent hydrolase [Listeria monocytogenes]EAD0532562.1 metal-dependent hydrolase [Listeria monocytogenes]EAE1964018.1 metal-dependent hydrolase [Listeria monocytogenes]
MEIHYLGHSCILIESQDTRILIDPFLSENPLQTINYSELEVDFVALTHGHYDHVGDAVAIAKNTHCPIVASPELSRALGEEYDNFIPIGVGGTVQLKNLSMKAVIAFHGSGFTNRNGREIYSGFPTGYVVYDQKHHVYHAGDTALFSDMQLIGEEFPLDVAILPIGDHYTMGMADAIQAEKYLKAKTILPVHYNTFAAIQIDLNIWKAKVEEADFKTDILAYNELITLD